jgi:hypothetical protein
MNDIVITGTGDAARLIEAFTFLIGSADHGTRAVTLEELEKELPDAAISLRTAIGEDGFDAEPNLERLYLSVTRMVSGRVERDVLIGRLSLTEFGQSSVEYVIEGKILLGRRYRFTGRKLAFLEHEIRTGDREPVFVTGNTAILGNWNTERALPLGYNGFGRGGHHWSLIIPVFVGETIEFKFIKKAVIWENGLNRTFTADREGTLTTSDQFRE